jgi:hypothetical protein
MRNIIMIFITTQSFGAEIIARSTELSPLFNGAVASEESISDEDTASSSSERDEQEPIETNQEQDITPNEQEIMALSIKDRHVLENELGMSEVAELIEEIVRYRRFLSTHYNDFNKAIDERNYTTIFLSTLTEIKALSGLKELQDYFAQVYYDMQIKALYNRLDRGRSAVYKTLGANNWRTSATQESINSLNVYATLLNLNVHSDSGYLGMIIQFFSQPEPASIYFPKLFSALSEKDHQSDLLDIALTYLIERYRIDRSWFNKILHYCGLKHSYTREAITTLQNIAKLLNIRVREDYQRLLNAADQKMIEDALEYLLTWGE